MLVGSAAGGRRRGGRPRVTERRRGARLSRIQPLFCGFLPVIPRMPKVARPFSDNTLKFSKSLNDCSIECRYNETYTVALNLLFEISISEYDIWKNIFLNSYFPFFYLVKLPFYQNYSIAMYKWCSKGKVELYSFELRNVIKLNLTLGIVLARVPTINCY